MTDFDGLRCAVITGDGVVARFPGVVCLAGGGDRALLSTLIEHCQKESGVAPGRVLVRRLTTWLAQLGDAAEGLSFGTVAATGDDRLSVFLLGDMRLRIPESGIEVSGADAAAWTDRLLTRPDSEFFLAKVGAEEPRDAAAGLCDLRLGVVPGAAAVLLPAAAELPENPGTQPYEISAATETAAPMPAVTPSTVPPGPTPRPQPIPSAQPAPLPTPQPPTEAIIALPPDIVRPPVPSGEPTLAVAAGAPQAQGHLCSRGHLNDPRSHFCVLCGIRMNERTNLLVFGPRPPLGLLVFENGATYTVDADYLIGRNPEADDRVLSGALRPIAVDDDSGAVSRMHAEIRLDNWDVLISDAGSSNGTAVAAPGQDWRQLAHLESCRLIPGTQVRLGDSLSFVFESPSGGR
jgi:hypothetical protein